MEMDIPSNTPSGEVTPPTIARSFLYVPGNKPPLFDKGAASGADAIILDLEDAVPLTEKAKSRADVAEWLQANSPGERSRAQTWVRVDPSTLNEDLEAVVRTGLEGLILAKCSVLALKELSCRLDQLECERGLATGSIGVIGLLETAGSLLELTTLAGFARVVTFGIGEVDLLGDLRMRKTSHTAVSVDGLRTQVVINCAAAGLAAPVAPTDTAFRDLEAFRESSERMLDLGFRSRTAIHPSQVTVIHEVFTPTDDEVGAARDVLARFEAAHGGVTVDADGRLIDAAVIREAHETLSRCSDRA